MRLQSAIFDMDGTLIDSMWAWERLMPELLEEANIPLTPELEARMSSMSVQETIRLFQVEFNLPWTTEEIFERFESRMAEFYRDEVKAKPGVEKFLALLKMEGVWMYVATATSRHLVEIALKSTGLDKYFRGIITSDEAGQSKRVGPAVYERALTRLQSNKKDTVIFEDALHAIRTAKAAGFRVAAVYDAAADAHQAEIRELADYYYQSFEEMFEARTLEN